ncbi:coagulase domain-containing protein [Staphylococcus aureus]|uniref:coagulase domain-containing protein n=1 Tax=Staphylococcus aureus TaxID=1280 RepID=UPI000E036927|nr:coagulase domain-containing protein [Staphylococcus aureus]SUK03276.1 staphylocoagulase [Staphylococcus aureus]SUK11231.1 staphylocoagulase [Staphylococcus aureus]HDP5919746.1 coagulase [Staphylococcus aureus]
MKKKMITLGTVAIATSLFTWDNKADAIVNDNYTGQSQVKEDSKNSNKISNDSLYWGVFGNLEAQFKNALNLLKEYQYSEEEYKEAKDKLMTRIVSENQYLLDKKFKEYEAYKAAFPNFKAQNPTLKRLSFDNYDIRDLRQGEYNDIRASLKNAVETFHKDVSAVQSKQTDLKTFDQQEMDQAKLKINELENKALMLGFAFSKQTDARQDLYNKLDMILGYSEKERTEKQPKNKRMFEETVKDLETIMDEFFTDIGKQRPSEIPTLTDNNENNKALAKSLRDLTNSITSNSSQKKTVDKVVKKPDTQSTGNKEFVIKEPTKPSIPTYTEEITKKPMPSIKQEIKEKIIYSSPQRFAGLSGERDDSSTSYNSLQTRITTNSNLVEFEEDTSARSQYGPRPQFNKTPKYIKYKDASTGIHEYNDGTFGYEARPKFNKPASTNKYNVTTKQDGTVSYGARPTFNKSSYTNAYNVTTHANGTTTYGPRVTK